MFACAAAFGCVLKDREGGSLASFVEKNSFSLTSPQLNPGSAEGAPPFGAVDPIVDEIIEKSDEMIEILAPIGLGDEVPQDDLDRIDVLTPNLPELEQLADGRL